MVTGLRFHVLKMHTYAIVGKRVKDKATNFITFFFFFFPFFFTAQGSSFYDRFTLLCLRGLKHFQAAAQSLLVA